MKFMYLFLISLIIFSCKKHESYNISGTLYHHQDIIVISYGSIDIDSDGTIDETVMSSPLTGIFEFNPVPHGNHKITAIAYVGEDTITGESQIKTGRFENYHIELGKVDEPGHHH